MKQVDQELLWQYFKGEIVELMSLSGYFSREKSNLSGSHSSEKYDQWDERRKARSSIVLMHQLIPAAPSRRPPPPPSGYCGAFARLVSPGGGAFATFALPGGQVFANPGAKPMLLTRTRFPIRI